MAQVKTIKKEEKCLTAPSLLTSSTTAEHKQAGESRAKKKSMFSGVDAVDQMDVDK